MARSRQEEARFLTREEQDIVARTHHPAIQGVAEGELADLIRLLRDRRDRARNIANRQRREMRGKAEGTARDDAGTRAKRDVLAAALQRANKELDRRRTEAAKDATVKNANRALAMKRATEEFRQADHPAADDRSAGEGMHPVPNEDIAPSGALNAEGHRPVVHRTRLPR
ncbi:hypothetical protein [Indioceanicola profundi]|uniref:hypothetical protein n=1 Tax=Indioceanicola profundi TaxID=2220096 RepID=UPI000E6AD3E5|nr:hypothetical protein [Indioceanicola profundi]